MSRYKDLTCVSTGQFRSVSTLPHLEETVNREINRSEAALCSSSQLSDCENCQKWDVAQLLICLHWCMSLPFPQHLLALPASLRLWQATAGAAQRRPLTSSGGSASLADTCPLTADGTYYYELHFHSSAVNEPDGLCILAQMDVVIIRARKCMRWKQASTFLPWNGKKTHPKIIQSGKSTSRSTRSVPNMILWLSNNMIRAVITL